MDAPLSSQSAAPPEPAPAPVPTTSLVTAQPPAAPAPPHPQPDLSIATAPPSTQSEPTAWPRSAQAALVCLLILATILLGLQIVRSLSLGSRPTELERGPGLGYRIDLNRASLAELMQMPGVGDARAREIVAYRRQAGGFRKVSDLLQVHGIGLATFERLKPWVCVESEEADEEDEPPARIVNRGLHAAKKVAAQPIKGEKRPNKKVAGLKGKIDINRASIEELQKLPLIGAKKAQRIVDERAKGRFQKVDDLKRVSGIKDKTLEMLRPHVTVSEEAVRVVKAE
jgi:competence ComEA-like helix-hairpin-helix protein